MASLSVRGIDEEVYRRLRMRAANEGISMEEAVRRILRQTVSGPERLGALAVSVFGPDYGVDLELAERQPHEPPTLDP